MRVIDFGGRLRHDTNEMDLSIQVGALRISITLAPWQRMALIGMLSTGTGESYARIDDGYDFFLRLPKGVHELTPESLNCREVE